MKKSKQKNNGITLIALVVTVIVLLILAGVTIATLTGENGIITKAIEARDETERASIIEQAKIDILEIQTENQSGNITQEQLKNVLDKYFDGVPDDYTIDDIFTTKDEYGNHEIAVSEIYNGEINGTGTTIPEGLEIGTIVSYNPDGTYTWQSEYCSSPEDTSYEKILDSSSYFNIDTWRVFEINEETGKITLVPEHSTDDGNDGASETSGTVYLRGAQGYNNAVYLLNEACSNLYGDSSKGITARSINIEDIEGKMTDSALEQAHNYSNAAKYGEQVSNAYTQANSYYPSLYSQETLSVINGSEKTSGLGMSQQTDLVESTDNGATNGSLQASTNIQPYQTYWYGENSFMQTAFETANNGVNYYDLLMPDDTNTYYWVASRCVDPKSSYCNFNVSFVNGGEVNADRMLNSYVSGRSYCYGLFPVVTLSSELISGNTTDGFSVE